MTALAAVQQPGDPLARPGNHPKENTVTQPDVIDEAQRFIQQCGSCDAGLPMNCTCPTGDYRSVMARLIAEVERLRIRDHIAELAIGYVSEPVENTDRVTERYYELEAAVRHMQAVDARSANLAREVAQHQRALRDRIRPNAQP